MKKGDNPSPGDKTLSLSKLNPFPDDNFIIAQMAQYFFETVANTKPLPNQEVTVLSKFKAFADDKLIVFQNLKLLCKNIAIDMGKGENAGHSLPHNPDF